MQPTLPSRSVAPIRATETGEKKLMIGEMAVIWERAAIETVTEAARGSYFRPKYIQLTEETRFEQNRETCQAGGAGAEMDG